jgi:signal peptidase I
MRKVLDVLRNFWKDWYVGILIIVVFLVIKQFVVMPYKFTGDSMCDTFNFFDGECVKERSIKGEYGLVNRFIYLFSEPKRGDVIVFDVKGYGKYVKRVIALPGEKVNLRDGEVYITLTDGQEIKLDESSYLNEENNHNTQPWMERTTYFEVPEKGYFLMGDNRPESADSRACFIYDKQGCFERKKQYYAKKSDIVGRVDAVVWPVSELRKVKEIEY